jgi:hypothetical protein
MGCGAAKGERLPSSSARCGTPERLPRARHGSQIVLRQARLDDTIIDALEGCEVIAESFSHADGEGRGEQPLRSPRGV